MTKPPRPYLKECPLCEQGLIRVAICRECQRMVALCDDCEAIWADPKSLAGNPPPDSQHPTCPHCGYDVNNWKFATSTELKKAGLSQLIIGTSE